MARNTTVLHLTETGASAGMAAAQKSGVTKKKSMRRGESLTSPRRIKSVTEKQLPALEYRRMGYSYAQIAEALGFSSAQAAHKAVTSVLKRVTRKPSDDLVLLELERVDALFVRPYQDALAGDLAALAACLSLMERKSRLLGLDAPVKGHLPA
jgi:hypothetical protein